MGLKSMLKAKPSPPSSLGGPRIGTDSNGTVIFANIY